MCDGELSCIGVIAHIASNSLLEDVSFYIVFDILPNFPLERFDLFCYQQEHMRPPAALYSCLY